MPSSTRNLDGKHRFGGEIGITPYIFVQYYLMLLCFICNSLYPQKAYHNLLYYAIITIRKHNFELEVVTCHYKAQNLPRPSLSRPVL